MRKLWFFAALLSGMAFVFSGWLYFLQGHLSTWSAACHLSADFDCAPALASRYSKLFSIPISGFAMPVYLVLGALSVQSIVRADRSDRNAIFAALISLPATFFGAWLAYISVYRIKAYCPYCLVLQIVNPLILISAIVVLSDRTNSFRSLRETALRELKSLLADIPAMAGVIATVLVIVGLPFYFHYRAPALLYPAQRAALDGTIKRLRDWEALVANRPFLGHADAPVTIIEFADVTCPACIESHEVIQRLLTIYDIKFFYVNYPLSKECNPMSTESRRGSCRGALAASYATTKGRFWYAYGGMFTDAALRDQAGETELAMLAGAADWSEIASDTAAKIYLEEDLAIAAKAEISATPFFLLNGIKVEGLPDEQFLEDLIERETQRVGATKPPQ